MSPPSSSEPKVGIVLVTYNDESHLDILFSSLRTQNYSNYRVILIDNASKDHSVAKAKALCPEGRIVELKENTGFARASNQGAAFAQEESCRFILILNNDVELDHDCLGELVSLLKSDQHLACVGPIIFRGRRSERPFIQEYGGRADYAHYAVKKNYVGRPFEPPASFPDILDVDFIMGGALLIRADVVEKIGLFDERYYMYGEEIDLFCRLRRLGLRMAVTKKARLWHDHYSADRNPKRYCFERYYSVRNKYLYFWKYGLYGGLIRSLWKDVIFTPLYYKGHLKRGQLAVIWHHYRGLLDGFRNRTGKADKVFV
jgi:GT2 family glycosyltransferase